MSLASILRSGIATAKSILQTGELLATVYVLTCDDPVTRNPDGTPIRTGRTGYQALVSGDLSQGSIGLRRTATGVEFLPKTKVLFLEAVTIGPDDALELPDGTVPEFHTIDRGVQPASDGSLIVTVYCG